MKIKLNGKEYTVKFGYAPVVKNKIIPRLVGMGQQFTILIPFTGKYLPYKDWKNLADKTGFYTLSPSDVIILGTVEEDVNDKNIITIKNDYEPDSCEVMSIEQVDKKLSVKFEFRVGGV